MRIRGCLRLQKKCVLRLNVISVHRPIIRTTAPIISGINREQAVWFPHRELSLDELKELRANIPDDLEIETFVHGAMCISYSGRCLLSNYFTGQRCEPGGHVPTRAAGSMRLWRRQDRESICRSMRTKEELISSIPRICV